MAYQIRVSPDALRAAAVHQREISARVSDIRADVGALTKWLDGAWDGNASNQAIEGLFRLQRTLAEVAEVIDQRSELLRQMAQSFENAENCVIYRAVVSSIRPATFRLGLSFNASFSGTAVRISPDEVRTVAKRIHNEAQELRDVSRMLVSHMRALEGDWDGRACRKFCQDIDVLAEGVEFLSNEVEEFAHKIHFAAARFEEMDNSL